MCVCGMCGIISRVRMSYVNECGMVVCVHTNVDIHLYAYDYYMWVQCCGAYVVYSIWLLVCL